MCGIVCGIVWGIVCGIVCVGCVCGLLLGIVVVDCCKWVVVEHFTGQLVVSHGKSRLKSNLEPSLEKRKAAQT